MLRRLLPLVVFLAAALPPLGALARPCGQAAPCGAITLEGPIPTPFPAGDPSANPNIPGGGRPVEGLAQPTVEEEFFFGGSVDVFNYDAFPAFRGDHPGDRLVAYYKPGQPMVPQPYKTRMLVRRPATADAFSGDVVIESMNSTAGFDSTPVWLPSAEYFAREGIVYIGVTTSGSQAIPFLKPHPQFPGGPVTGCGGINPPCGTRYATLQMSDNGQEYELINQLVTALKSGDLSQIPLPADFGPVQHVFFSGQSQQGGSIITHASQFHFSGIDGYFFMGASGVRAIRGGFSSAALGLDLTSRTCGTGTGTSAALPYPNCVAPLTGLEVRVRTDLPAPVYRGSSETDIGNGTTRQDDTDTSPFASFRLIEVPATAHNVVHKSPLPFPGLPPGFTIGDLCLNLPYTMADGPIFGNHVWNAMWENLRIQVTQGVRPPYAPRVLIAGGVISRDSFQNAKGGVRLPELDVPTNSYFLPNNFGKPACVPPQTPADSPCVPSALAGLGGLACFLSGSLAPLPQATLNMLYSNHGSYVSRIAHRANVLVKARFLLPEDAELHKTAAGESEFGQGGRPRAVRRAAAR